MSALTYPRRCSHYHDWFDRCRAQATHHVTEHGEVVPYAGLMCEEHARAVVEEYAEKMPAMGYDMAEIEEGS